jgi:putative transposase
LGCAQAGRTADLHRRQRHRRPRRLRAARRTLGAALPAIVRLWDNAWSEFIPFLDYDIEIRRVLCSTNAIESLNARYRRAVKARGHFPSEQAALKCLYLVTRSLDPTGRGRQRWAQRWKPALNAFSITFADRFPAAETY